MMDGCRFDALTRRVGRGATRRGALGLTVAAASAVIVGRDAAAACDSQGAFCKKAANCCSKVCTKVSGRKKCWCRQLGEACTVHDNCCTVPTMECGVTTGTKKQCCVPGDLPCSTDSDCCGNDSSCSPTSKRCIRPCRETGRTCSVNEHCCSGFCNVIVGICNCAAGGDPCDIDEECCSGSCKKGKCAA